MRKGGEVIAALRRGLEDLGWVQGRNVQLDIRWAAGDPGKARDLARELIGTAPDVIVPSSNLVTTIMVQETRTIPIVFILVGDPVGSGYVASMARPGGNATGFAVLENAIAGKWVETLHEIAPRVRRVGFILHPETPANVGLLHAAEPAAPSGVEVIPLGVHNTAEIERAITAFATEPDGGLIAAPHAVTFANRDVIVELASRFKLPTVYAFRTFAIGGGLVSYGTNPIEMWRQGASYVDRVLKGAARRLAGAISYDVRTGRQSQDRKGARPRYTTVATRPRRRGNRLGCNLLRCVRPDLGPYRKCSCVTLTCAFGQR